jgi:hypothetical protein
MPEPMTPWWKRTRNGSLTIRPDQRIACHLCQLGFDDLERHVRQRHSISGPQYKWRFRLAPHTSLRSIRCRRRARRAALAREAHLHSWDIPAGADRLVIALRLPSGMLGIELRRGG